MNRLRNVYRSMLGHQSGVSLVEVLVSVTILSFVSLTIMGYFIQSVESSSEDSRRIVAIKLAKEKVEQLRVQLRDDAQTMNRLSIFDPLQAEESILRVSVNDVQSPSPENDRSILNQLEILRTIRSETNINGVEYHFLVDFYPDQQPQFAGQFERFTQGTAVNTAGGYLCKFRLTVYWGVAAGDIDQISKRKSVFLDSYVVFRR